MLYAYGPDGQARAVNGQLIAKMLVEARFEEILVATGPEETGLEETSLPVYRLLSDKQKKDERMVYVHYEEGSADMDAIARQIATSSYIPPSAVTGQPTLFLVHYDSKDAYLYAVYGIGNEARCSPVIGRYQLWE